MALPHSVRLLEIMARLRSPDGGCPWDLQQNFASIAPYTIEEAYEVAEAIARGDRTELKEELGDLLLQVVFHAQMAKEEGNFDFEDVAAAINEKMIRRHPHVFGDATITDAAAQVENWETIKEQERREKISTNAPHPDFLRFSEEENLGNPTSPQGEVSKPRHLYFKNEAGSVTSPWGEVEIPMHDPHRAEGHGKGISGEGHVSILANIPLALPALMRAQKLQSRAARVGFDWPDARGVLDKIKEELAEVEEALASGDKAHIAEELGDLLFAVVNLARFTGHDAEAALRQTNQKFTRRFQYIERALAAQERNIKAATLEEMEALWVEAKGKEVK